MKHKHAIASLLFLLLILHCSDQQSGSSSSITVPVSVEEILPRPIEEFLVITATVAASKEALLNSELSGEYRLQKNLKTRKTYALGDFVKKGQVIIRLFDQEYASNIKIESQKLNVDIAKREFEKKKSLYDKGGITASELNNAELSYTNAKYNYENARVRTSKMSIAAPFDGVIVDLPYYTQNTRVNNNQPMTRIMDYRTLYMEARLSAKEMGRVKPEQEIRVMNYSLPDDTLQGTASQVSPAIDPDTRTFKAAFAIQNPDWKFRPGMFVKAELIVDRRDSTIVVPKDIVLSRQNRKRVFVVNRGRANMRTIQTGLENADEIEVLKGLEIGERLIVKGFETLQNRSRVKVLQ